MLATGGIGQVFAATTNPSVSTGDGVALALRAGAAVADLEFVQFHPTVLWLGGGARGQQPLVSEAVRGEGAYLVDDDGERFMAGQHELAELAPARRGRQGDHAPDAARPAPSTSVSTPGTSARRRGGAGSRRSCATCRAPASTRSPN